MSTRSKFAVGAGIAAVLFGAAASLAQVRVPYNARPNSVRVRAGQFEPDGQSRYWNQRARDFFTDASSFEDSIVGVDYIRMLDERLGVIGSLAGWEGSDVASFRDYVDDLGGEIQHEATLRTTSLDLGLVYYFRRRDAKLSPYIGGGGGWYSYELEESGDFIDFDDFHIFNGTFKSDGDTWGWYWMLGLELSLTQHVGVFGQARWTSASDELTNDFRGFGDIDLGGRDWSLGVSYRF